ncbi:hypothetical protein [Mangrovibacterium lignilyticum]|uniref:hypothetical protein n=1 Tax=Mangrovibacterium lignilyticum TaxID=2668052 RepID=UPI0013CFFFA0|nr:hypothetical protein [Mangrovibacterium lignilyticum]
MKPDKLILVLLLAITGPSFSCFAQDNAVADISDYLTKSRIDTIESPFDKRLMDLTGYLAANKSLLNAGIQKGINYRSLIWDQGYTFTTNGTEYIIVLFKVRRDSVGQMLVAHRTSDGFSAVIREGHPYYQPGPKIPKGKVIYRTLDGISTLIEEYEHGKRKAVRINTQHDPDFH